MAKKKTEHPDEAEDKKLIEKMLKKNLHGRRRESKGAKRSEKRARK